MAARKTQDAEPPCGRRGVPPIASRFLHGSPGSAPGAKERRRSRPSWRQRWRHACGGPACRRRQSPRLSTGVGTALSNAHGPEAHDRHEAARQQCISLPCSIVWMVAAPPNARDPSPSGSASPALGTIPSVPDASLVMCTRPVLRACAVVVGGGLMLTAVLLRRTTDDDAPQAGRRPGSGGAGLVSCNPL